MNKIKPLALAIPLLAMGLGVSGNANASAYAISYNTAVEGTVDIWQELPGAAGTSCSLINSGIAGVANCPSGTTISNLAFPPLNTNGSAATLNGSGPPALSDGPGLGVKDVDMSATGTAVGTAQNNYTAIGITGTNYSRGDAVLNTEQVGTINTDDPTPGIGSVTNASPGITLSSKIDSENIAEAEIATQGTATADGNVSSGTLTQITLSLATPGQIAFSFDFNPFMQVSLDSDVVFGSVARATLEVSFNIVASGAPGFIFNWAPDGVVGAITGGTELLDPYALNGSIETQIAGTGSTYDPTGGGINDAVTFARYRAYTNTLAAGTYTLNIIMKERVEVTRVVAVPEPSIIGLMGLGLIGAGFASRRIRRKT